jgi:hypothetical protein
VTLEFAPSRGVGGELIVGGEVGVERSDEAEELVGMARSILHGPEWLRLAVLRSTQGPRRFRWGTGSCVAGRAGLRRSLFDMPPWAQLGFKLLSTELNGRARAPLPKRYDYRHLRTSR